MPNLQGEETMLSAAVMMESQKIVASLLGGKVNPNDTKGFKARKSVFPCDVLKC